MRSVLDGRARNATRDMGCDVTAGEKEANFVMLLSVCELISVVRPKLATLVKKRFHRLGRRGGIYITWLLLG